jgi:hypothetical protein
MTMEKQQRQRKVAGAAGAAPPEAEPAAKPTAKPTAKSTARPTAKRTSTRKRAEPPAPRILQLRITLLDIEPPIWRQILVPDDFTFEDLDVFVRGAIGWGWDHAHAFSVPRRGSRRTDAIDEYAELRQVLCRARQKILYEYDFGDDWRHEILVEKIVPFEAEAGYPVCLGGARACPVEDCGGVYGYYRVLEALSKPTAKNAEWREWIGKYDPEAFDAEAVNRLWAGWRKPQRR